MKKVLRRIFLRFAALAVIGYLGMMAFLMAREDSLVFSGTRLGEDWGPVPQDSIAIPWDTLRVAAADDTPVFLLESRLEDEPDAPWAIFFHGNGLLVGSEACLARYRLLREAGFQVLAVEFRGYGMSGAGTPSEAGVYADGRAGWDYLTQEVGVERERIVVYGWSLGAAIATHLASQVEPAGLITEGASTSLPDIAQGIYWWLPIRLIIKNRFENLARADSLALPWLLFHSRNDDVVPFSHAETLAVAGGDTQIVELDTGHNGGVARAPEVALPALRDFAAQVFPGPSPVPRDQPQQSGPSDSMSAAGVSG